MLQYFVEFSLDTQISSLWGTHGITKTKVCSLNQRDLGEVWNIRPEDAYAFRFFNQNVVECEDGEVIHGEKKDWSGYYYYGQGPFSEEELLEMEQKEKFKKAIKILKAIHESEELDKDWKRSVWNLDEEVEAEKFPDDFVIAINRKIYPLYHNDSIIIDEIEL